jgi:aromatic ring-opening dioxygenase catalytic subunit (LigB family)
MASTTLPRTQSEWQDELESLPSNANGIPAFFFAHGSPLLAFPASTATGLPGSMLDYAGPNGPLAKFLRDFGKALLAKYKPKGILVFSAHWETLSERVGTRRRAFLLPRAVTHLG